MKRESIEIIIMVQEVKVANAFVTMKIEKFIVKTQIDLIIIITE